MNAVSARSATFRYFASRQPADARTVKAKVPSWCVSSRGGVLDGAVGDDFAVPIGGQQAAWARLVETFGEMVWFLSGTDTLTEEYARAEVCRVVWLRLAQRLETFESIGAVGRWLAETTRGEVERATALRALRQGLDEEWSADNVVAIRHRMRTGR